MSRINIYKINNDLENQLIQELTDENDYELSDEEFNFELESNYLENIQYNFSMHLYYKDEQQEKGLSWNWVREQFNLGDVNYSVKPKAVLLINEYKIDVTKPDEFEDNIYAVSFGYAFHTLKHFSDKDWPIKFAEHITLNKVKSMTVLSPNSVINKRINNYVNFKDILLDSGEALNQLSANLELDDDFNDFKNSITISNSIIFDVTNPNLESLPYIIDYITFINGSDEIVNSIPYFKEVQSKIKKMELDNELIGTIFADIEEKHETPCIDICEFILVDGVLKFFNQFDNFKLKYKRLSKENIGSLTVNEIYNFIEEKLDDEDNPLEIKIFFEDSEIGSSFVKLKDIISYDSFESPAILDGGSWWVYNSKYMDDLKNSINDLDVEYEIGFDFQEEDYLRFVRGKAQEEGLDFDNMDDNTKKRYKQKWYKERVFNLLREEDGFICNDRFKDYVDSYDIEVADLFKLDEKSMFSVKIGGASNLIYVVDQSLIPLKLIDNGEIRDIENDEIPELNKDSIKNVYLWLILTRKTKLPVRNGKPDLNEINSISLKNRIDYWKKEVIKSRRNPKIRINYIDF